MHRRLHINSNQFWTVRGKAIAAYADLEQSLCHLFSYLSDIPRNIAGIVFFKITSARSRNALIEELLTKRKQRQKYSAFWKAYFKDMGQLDQRRNEIVHWMVVSVIDTADPEQPHVDLHLRPPKYWSELGLSSPEINAADMSSFIGKCDVLARACNMFTHGPYDESRAIARYISATTNLSAFTQSTPSAIPEAQSTAKPASSISNVTLIQRSPSSSEGFTLACRTNSTSCAGCVKMHNSRSGP